uniref:phage holin family protein n=1 Tax=Clostridium sp. NkU-1 TaxID=1095009 RepID=UPI00326140AC
MQRLEKNHTESSSIGIIGIAKKIGYWIIVSVSFLIPSLFINLGKDMFGINLSFLELLGWFTLATLLINEIRSILENLVEYGCDVPEFLIKGLAVTEKLISAGANKTE